MHHLSIAISHPATLSEYAQTHTRIHTQTRTHSLVHAQTHFRSSQHLPGMAKTHYYLLLCVTADAAIISWPRCVSPSSPCAACVHLFRFLSLSLSSLASAALLMFMFIQTRLPLSLSSPPPLPVSPTAPACPAFVTSLVSITTATFPSCLTIFNREQRTTEMRREMGGEFGGEGYSGDASDGLKKKTKTMYPQKERYVRWNVKKSNDLRASHWKQSLDVGNILSNR